MLWERDRHIGRREDALRHLKHFGVLLGDERAKLTNLFAEGYARRTLVGWAIMFCTSVAGYGLITWLPTILSDCLPSGGITSLAV